MRRTSILFAAWHACSEHASQPTGVDGLLPDGECDPFTGAECDVVLQTALPLTERVDLTGEVCRDPARELPFCLLSDDLESACLQWFDGSGLTTCPQFSQFVAATGWLAGEQQTAIASAEVRRCDSMYSERQYDYYFWSDTKTSYGNVYWYSHQAYFDTSTGNLVSLQNYQAGVGEFGLYPELYCCDGELTFGTVTGSPVAVDCATPSSHEYDRTEFASSR